MQRLCALLPSSLTSLELTVYAVDDPAAPHLSNLVQLELLYTRMQASLLHSFPKLRRLVLTSRQALISLGRLHQQQPMNMLHRQKLSQMRWQRLQA